MDHQVGSSAMNLVRSKIAGGPGCQSWPLYWKLASMLFSWLLVTWSADALVRFPMAAVRWIGPDCTLGPPGWLLVVLNAHIFVMALVDNSNRNKMYFNEGLIWQSLRNPWVVNSRLQMGIHRWLCQTAPWCPFYGYCLQTHEPYHWKLYECKLENGMDLKKHMRSQKALGKQHMNMWSHKGLWKTTQQNTCQTLTSSNAFFSLTVCIAKVWQWSGHNMVTTTMVWPWLSKTDVGHGMAMAIVQWPFTSSWPLACWSSWLSWPSWPS